MHVYTHVHTPVCTCIYMYVYRYIHTYTHMWRTILGIIRNTIQLFRDRSSHWPRIHQLGSADPPVSPRDPLIFGSYIQLLISSTGIASAHHHPSYFHGCRGNEVRPSSFHGKGFS